MRVLILWLLIVSLLAVSHVFAQEGEVEAVGSGDSAAAAFDEASLLDDIIAEVKQEVKPTEAVEEPAAVVEPAVTAKPTPVEPAETKASDSSVSSAPSKGVLAPIKDAFAAIAKSFRNFINSILRAVGLAK
jgi:hypothetical protein